MSGVDSRLLGDIEQALAVPTIATVFSRLDSNARELDALRRENHKLRHEKANALGCAEAERAESARLRAENQRLAGELATANAYRNGAHL